MTRNVVLENVSPETIAAVNTLMKKEGSPFTSIEDCIETMLSYRVMLQASGEDKRAELLDTLYHLSGIKVIVNYPVKE
ncbi:MAG TPA: hypothetical protein O0X25_03955 [Methanocorpusculum sp.]|nr:hypothetical protein [Methanocorpusculum sp.]HJJ40331.1 hypothetical protein [Methanocorpusculum sp.]HJJ49752.1 hypothetical protein [Methanocorpusculum sp.]HJJ57584.1 hypothetical protein [Methanocorpusculum sp.]